MTSTAEILRRAIAEHQSGKLKPAARAYEKVLAKDPRNANATHLLGLVRVQSGDVEAAVALLLSAVQMRPENPTFRFNLGLAQATLGQRGAAIHSYRASLTHNRANPAAVSNLAILLGEDGDLNGAEEVLRQGLIAVSGDAAIAINLADVLCRKALPEQMAEAEALCRRVLGREPVMAKAHSILAQTMSIGDRRGEAVIAARRAAELEPGNALFQEQLADLYAKTGDDDAAEATARRALDLGGSQARPAGILGAALLGLNRPHEAIEWCQLALELDRRGLATSESAAAANLYVAYLKDGQADAASRLVDLKNLVYLHKITTPDEYENIAAFNEELAEAIQSHPSLRWNPSGYVTRGGAITGNLLLQPSVIFGAMEGAIRNGIEGFSASLTNDPAHYFQRDLARRYRMVMWAVILNQEGFLETHIHEGAWISGVYYVSIPEFKNSSGAEQPGAIEFGRPSKHHNMDEGSETRVVEPSDGSLVLFPASMFHRTIPFEADAKRICISFNCFPY